MRNLTPALTAHIASGGTSLAVCWRIERTDGVVLRSTEHDRSILVEVDTSDDVFGVSGEYAATQGFTASNFKASSDLSVSNMETNGALSSGQGSDYTFDGISGDDLEAGLFDKARYLIFQVNWQAPDEGVLIVSRGTLGNIKRDSDSRWTCELRSISQALSQVQGRSYGVLCDATLGDERCGVNLDDFTFAGIVGSVTSNREFAALIDPFPLGSDSLMVSQLPDGYLAFGKLTFTTGENAGYSREVASDTDGNIEVFESFPRTIAEDDEFVVSAGCNKELNIEVDGDGPPTIENGRVTGDCAVKFDNAINFRGFPNKPGPDTLVRLRVPDRKSSGGGGKK